MTKTVPWNLHGVGLASRVTAREAARRDGTSLGEWLDRVILEHTSRLGQHEDVDGSLSRGNGSAEARHASPRGIKFRRNSVSRQAKGFESEENGEVLYPRFVRARAEQPAEEGARRLRRPGPPTSRFGASRPSHPASQREDEAALLLAEAAAERGRGGAQDGDPTEARLAQVEARLDKLAALMDAAPRATGRANNTRAPLENLRRMADEFARGAPRAFEGGSADRLAELDRKIGLANEAAAEAYHAAGRIVGAGDRGNGRDARHEIAAMQRHQAASDERTQAALNAIHEILETMAGQLFDPEDYHAGAGQVWRAAAAPHRPIGRR